VRVCFLIDELATAGTECQLVALIQQLDRSRVAPHLVLLRGDSPLSQSLEPRDCPVMRLGVGSLLRLRTGWKALQFIQFLWRHKIDVVQAYFPDSSYFGIAASWLGRVPHRLRTRNNVGHWLTTAHRHLGRALNLFTTATIANCDAARTALLRDEKPTFESVFVLENGVDLNRFLSIPLPTDRAVRVGAVANLRPVKGLDLLLAAAKSLCIEFPHVSFHIAGDGDREGMHRAIAEAGLVDRFHLHGAVTDVPAFLADLDVAVLPSRAEGMSNALLEYMAAARPIVASAVGATPEIVREGVDGLLVPPEDVAALQSNIRTLLVDRTLAHTLGASARQRASEKYSRAAMVRRFEDFYTRLLSEPSRGHHADKARRTHRHSGQAGPILG
jgi:glycosyltransferase involved in cell wall biosynthesis